jgi:predicted RNA methylase
METGLLRNNAEKYYTNIATVDTCLEKIRPYVTKNTDIIIEPSAGNGSFLKGLNSMSDSCFFYDLHPDQTPLHATENGYIQQQDYLTLDIKQFINTNPNPNRKIHVIGNPPFGRQSSLAIKFIKKSCSFCDTLSFILPKSFKKDSMKKHIPLLFHLKVEEDIPFNAFLVNGNKHNVPCVFQIWVREQHERQRPLKLVPYLYTFVSINEHPDISVRRVGSNAGFIDSVEGKSTQSHYFIKFDGSICLENVIDALKNNITYEFNNTVGPKSISKQEMIAKFNPVISN